MGHGTQKSALGLEQLIVSEGEQRKGPDQVGAFLGAAQKGIPNLVAVINVRTYITYKSLTSMDQLLI